MDTGHGGAARGGGVIYVFSREGARAVDRAAVQEFGLPSVVLMENAAGAVEAEALEALDDEDGLVLICCGPGANGGDGLSAARRLHNAGVRVAIALCADASTVKGDSAIHLHVARTMALPLREVRAVADLDALVREVDEPAMIIDALFGTGLDRPLEGAPRDVVKWINARGDRGVFVLAVDIPSGLDADSGAPIGAVEATVRADVTVALCGVKKGFLAPGAEDFVGEVVVGDIGAPVELLERFGEPLNDRADN